MRHNRIRMIGGVLLVFTVLRAVLAYTSLGYESNDYIECLAVWYNEICDNGGMAALSQKVGNYGIPYQFLMCVMTCLPVSSLTAYKALSLLSDILLALVCSILVYRFSAEADAQRHDLQFIYTYISVLFLPTVFLNSSVWAQCDSLYMIFAMGAVLCLCREHDAWAYVLMGIALSFKLQAVFILPALLIMTLVRRHLRYLPLMFISWYAMNIPGFLAGRSLLDPLTIYRDQTTIYNQMYMSFPSIWVLIGGKADDMKDVAIVYTVIVLAAFMLYILYRYGDHKEDLTPDRILEITCLMAWTCVELLPCMHERYSYGVEILLLVLVCRNLRYLPFLVVEEIIIVIRYHSFLFDRSVGDVPYIQAVLYLLAFLAYAVVTVHHMAQDPSLEEAA